MSKPTSFIVEDRLMMSRANASFITVTNVVPHGHKTYGCCACCYAPEICPGCSVLPCIRDPKYIVKEMEASKYIYIRENSLEWNAPIMIQKEVSTGIGIMNQHRRLKQKETNPDCGRSPTNISYTTVCFLPFFIPLCPIALQGNCFGSSCCYFRAQDNVNVIYFDDPMFDRISDKTPCCNDLCTWLNGGEGEIVEINAKFCFGCCYRAYPPFVCGFPVCCYVLAQCCCCAEQCPIIKANIWVENAKDAIRDIKEARDNAKARMQIS